jgi:anti-sigma B factor antagonist
MLLDVTDVGVEGGWRLIAAAGEIDISSAPVLEQTIDLALADGAVRIALDLGNVTFMDSTGLRTIMTTQRRLKDPGDLAVVVGAGPVRRLLEVAGVLDSLLVLDSTARLPET